MRTATHVLHSIALMTTTYSKIQARADREWYHQFADLVLSAERTWIGDFLRPRQLLRRQRDVNADGTERAQVLTVPNTVDGYHWSSTPLPRPRFAEALAKEVRQLDRASRASSGSAAAPVAMRLAGSSGSTWWYRMELLSAG